jgi:hypothetical protein
MRDQIDDDGWTPATPDQERVFWALVLIGVAAWIAVLRWVL